jgi:hypothetical protein
MPPDATPALAFLGGSLRLAPDGSAWICFEEQQLIWEQRPEAGYRVDRCAKVEPDQLAALRDFLDNHLPPKGRA